MSALYMAVTPDDLELPLAFSESLKEFAEMVNVKKQTVSDSICRNAPGTTIGMKFIKLNIEEDDDED